MKKKIGITLTVYFMCVLLVGCGGSIHNIRKGGPKVSTQDNQLKIMTFNIRVGCARDNLGKSPYRCTPNMENLNLVALAIQSENPDVVALQEVKGFSQAKYIAEKLNMNFSYISHGGSEWWGMAILSKFEILNSKSRNIHYGKDHRIGLICEIKINDRIYNFVNIHYHLGNYKRQVSLTIKITNKIDAPVVLLGDFNRREGDTEMEPVYNSFIDTCRAVSTENSKNVIVAGTGYGRIDYIFIQDKYFTVLDAGVYSLRDFYKASDHYGYYTVLKVKQ